MSKNSFFIGLITFFSFFIFCFFAPEVQAQCYSGSWAQPTCDPTRVDPGSCNILPPLFSGATCEQDTGYLRIDKYTTQARDKTYLTGGIIQVGDVTANWKPTNGGWIAAQGPIMSGIFPPASPPPSGYNSSGDIAAQLDISAGSSLQVGGSAYFYGVVNMYNRLNVSSITTISGDPRDENLLQVVDAGTETGNSLYVQQRGGSRGNILVLETTDRNTIAVDYRGYFSATQDFEIKQGRDSSFRIKKEDDNTLLNLDNVGQLTVGTSIFSNPGRIETYGEVVGRRITSYNSLNQPRGPIQGDYLPTSGTSCSSLTTSTVLFFDKTSNQWVCREPTAMGATGNLLSVLQAGSDASSFTGNVLIGGPNPTFIGSSGFTGPTLNIDANVNITTADSVIGKIDFTDAQSSSQAFIQVTRGSIGGQSTNMDFYTGNARAMYINHTQDILMGVTGGKVGIDLGGSNPTLSQKLEVGNPTAGETARIRITDTNPNDNAELQLKYNTGANDHWAIYVANNQDDSYRIWGGGSDRMVITQTGLVGLGVVPANARLHLFNQGSSGNTSLRLQYDYTDLNPNGERDSDWYLQANTTQGSFRVVNNSISRLTIMDSGNIGIGNNINNPSANLQVNPSNNVEGVKIVTSNFSPLVVRNSGDTADLFRVNQNGYVGVNVTPTNGRLHVSGTYSDGWSSGFRLTRTGDATVDDADFRINVIDSSTYFKNFYYGQNFEFRNSSDTAVMTIRSTSPSVISGNFGASNGANCSVGQVLIKTGVSTWACGAAGSDQDLRSVLSINNDADGQDILNVGNLTVNNKITVNTIDPVYTIQGEKYATYMPAMTGVKEETTGLFKLVYDQKSGLAVYTADFNKLSKESDLWLFAQTINYQENFDQVVALLTPAFDGRVWYEKDVIEKTLTIYAKPINQLSKVYEVSYRLTGPRFDYEQWPNTTDEDVEGLNLDKFLQGQ